MLLEGFFGQKKQTEPPPPPLGGGPFGLGDPDDKRLRKSEKTIIIPKMMREEATKRCQEVVDKFMYCVAKHSFSFPIKCKEERKIQDDCLLSYGKDPKFEQEMIDKYLEARSHYRRTGEPLEKVQRKKLARSGFC